jgi:hypothetical protein
MGEIVDKACAINDAAEQQRRQDIDTAALVLVNELTSLMVKAAQNGKQQAVLIQDAYASNERKVDVQMAAAAERLRLDDPELHVVHHGLRAQCGHSTAPHYLAIGWNGQTTQTIELTPGFEIVSRLNSEVVSL